MYGRDKKRKTLSASRIKRDERGIKCCFVRWGTASFRPSFLLPSTVHTAPHVAMHDDEANAKSLSVPHKSRTAEPTAATTRNTAIPPSTAQTDRQTPDIHSRVNYSSRVYRKCKNIQLLPSECLLPSYENDSDDIYKSRGDHGVSSRVARIPHPASENK